MAHRTEGSTTRLMNRLIRLEATLCLVGVRIALWLIPFRPLMDRLSQPVRGSHLSADQRLHAHQVVRRSIAVARRRLPFATTCLHRAIAAHWMLRRRGVNTTLYYGVARTPADGLTAHAWVQDGDVGVIGMRAMLQQRYKVVARYPEVVQRDAPS
jgi:hypothetical protein